MGICAGIDTAKAHLDASVNGAGKHVSNDFHGWTELATWLGANGVDAVGFEASGGYERAAAEHLAAAGLRVYVLDPARVRHFARGRGRRAKNDRIDARMIAEFLAANLDQLQPASFDGERTTLGEWLSAGELLAKVSTMIANHLAMIHDPAVRDLVADLRDRVAAAGRLAARQADEHLRHSERLRQVADLVTSVPGQGPALAAAVAAWLPELGRTDRRKVAALIGVAPYDQDSGAKRGIRCIAGGRKRLRGRFYMTAFAAIRHNPVVAALYAKLRAKGKTHKVAVIACVRRMASWLNAMARDGTAWDESRFAHLLGRPS